MRINDYGTGRGEWHKRQARGAKHWRDEATQRAEAGHKPCEWCGKPVLPKKHHSYLQWQSAKYCCRLCAGRGSAANLHQNKQAEKEGVQQLNGLEAWGGGAMVMPRVENRETNY